MNVSAGNSGRCPCCPTPIGTAAGFCDGTHQECLKQLDVEGHQVHHRVCFNPMVAKSLLLRPLPPLQTVTNVFGSVIARYAGVKMHRHSLPANAVVQQVFRSTRP